jgi:hypothetical protein
MFKENTVFVIGAGAGADINMPLGVDLKSTISRKLSFQINGQRNGTKGGDQEIWQAIQRHVSLSEQPSNDINTYLEKCQHIGTALPLAPSIDNFIHSHSGDEQIEFCAKLGIVKTIQESEEKSLLKIKSMGKQRVIDTSRCPDSWYVKFWELLSADTTISNVENIFNNLTFVVFNYDRSLEYFLYYALRLYYRTNSEDSAEIVKNAKIFHPYGHVGEQPWDTEGVFRVDRSVPQELLDNVKNIKTFTESTRVLGVPDEIQAALTSAQTVVFLGFSYLQQNMDLLARCNSYNTTVTGVKKDLSIFGTAVGESEENISVARQYLGQNVFKHTRENRIHLDSSLECAPLLRNNRATLTM